MSTRGSEGTRDPGQERMSRQLFPCVQQCIPAFSRLYVHRLTEDDHNRTNQSKFCLTTTRRRVAPPTKSYLFDRSVLIQSCVGRSASIGLELRCPNVKQSPRSGHARHPSAAQVQQARTARGLRRYRRCACGQARVLEPQEAASCR
jgi:hypothetical protein